MSLRNITVKNNLLSGNNFSINSDALNEHIFRLDKRERFGAELLYLYQLVPHLLNYGIEVELTDTHLVLKNHIRIFEFEMKFAYENITLLEEKDFPICVVHYKPETEEHFDPNGMTLGMLNETEHLDLVLQIKRKNVAGYYVLFNDEKHYILTDGTNTFEDYPKGLYDQNTALTKQLYGF